MGYQTVFYFTDGTRIKGVTKGDETVVLNDREAVEQALGWALERLLERPLDYIEHAPLLEEVEATEDILTRSIKPDENNEQ